MIKKIPINNSDVMSAVIEYDTRVEEQEILKTLGVTESAKIKLGKRNIFSQNIFSQVETYGGILHFLNSEGLEVAHTIMHLAGEPFMMAVFKIPREWAPEIKKQHLVCKRDY